MAKYTFTKKAVEDLTTIWDYTFETWSEKQADKYYELIIDACEDIAKSRVIGKPYQEIAEGVRGFKTGKHIIFYRELTPKGLEVLRILHERMNVKSKMDDEH